LNGNPESRNVSEMERLGVRLIAAARAGDLLDLQTVIADGADLDFRGVVPDGGGAKVGRGRGGGLGGERMMSPMARSGSPKDARTIYNSTPLGADVNAVNECGWSALHHAVHDRNPACSEALLAAGCDPTLENVDGETAIDVADLKSHDAQVAVLRRYGAVLLRERPVEARGPAEPPGGDGAPWKEI
ncbi:hypothetical protein T484DRAFT_1926127, partial [Baffinella frigidus]